jgi:hypothetical protein
MEMVCDIPNLEGILIQSSGDAWIVTTKEALLKHLKKPATRSR